MECFAVAGLSFDGRLCFYFVWDVQTEAEIWSSTKTDSLHLSLDKWIVDGHIEVNRGVAAARYRLSGIYIHTIAVIERYHITVFRQIN